MLDLACLNRIWAAWAGFGLPGLDLRLPGLDLGFLGWIWAAWAGFALPELDLHCLSWIWLAWAGFKLPGLDLNFLGWVFGPYGGFMDGSFPNTEGSWADLSGLDLGIFGPCGAFMGGSFWPGFGHFRPLWDPHGRIFFQKVPKYP